MRIAAAALMITAFGVAGAANAQPSRLSDAAYLQAARCVGLASSPRMGVADAKDMSKWLQSQSSGRDPYVLDEADQRQRDARRQADKAADPLVKATLDRELQGSCAQLRA